MSLLRHRFERVISYLILKQHFVHLIKFQFRYIFCICYLICSEILGQLKRFWKFSSVQELETNETLGLNDIFGIEIDLNVHRGRFVFDTTVCMKESENEK